MNLYRHGCRLLIMSLMFSAPALASPPPDGSQTATVRSHTFDLAYQVDPVSLPLTDVELWFTTDDGQNWHLFCRDPDAKSPVTFRCDQDGTYGFFLVLINAAGRSSAAPSATQEPQQWVLVDTAKPLVQIKQVRLVTLESDKQRRLAVSWAAYDANFSDRPVSMDYQIREKPGWHSIVTHLRNTRRFDWTVPDNVTGQLEIRLEVADRAGNVGVAVSNPIEMFSGNVSSLTGISPTDADSKSTASSEDPSTDAPAKNIDLLSRSKARELYDLGLYHRDRGDWALAADRLIEAINYDPTMTEPAQTLARMYYDQGNYQGSLSIHQGVLEYHSTDRDSLRGSALALVALRRYPEALTNLEHVLASNPEDGQTWMDAGDVFLWMGKRDGAKNYWEQAMKFCKDRKDLKTEIEGRLKKYLGEK